MKSAVSLDDIPDPKLRKFLCDSLYKSEAQLVQKEVVGSFYLKPLQKVMSRRDNEANFTIESEVIPKLPKGWSGKINDWDRRQIRSITNRDKMFWTTTKLPKRYMIVISMQDVPGPWLIRRFFRITHIFGKTQLLCIFGNAESRHQLRHFKMY